MGKGDCCSMIAEFKSPALTPNAKHGPMCACNSIIVVGASLGLEGCQPGSSLSERLHLKRIRRQEVEKNPLCPLLAATCVPTSAHSCTRACFSHLLRVASCGNEPMETLPT